LIWIPLILFNCFQKLFYFFSIWFVIKINTLISLGSLWIINILILVLYYILHFLIFRYWRLDLRYCKLAEMIGQCLNITWWLINFLKFYFFCLMANRFLLNFKNILNIILSSSLQLMIFSYVFFIFVFLFFYLFLLV